MDENDDSNTGWPFGCTLLIFGVIVGVIVGALINWEITTFVVIVGLLAFIIYAFALDSPNKKEEELAMIATEEIRQRQIEFQEHANTAAEEIRQRQVKFQEQRDLFIQSSAYKLLEGFVVRFGKDFEIADQMKLETLLQKAGWNFSLTQLDQLIIQEAKIQRARSLESKILSTNPKTSKDLFKAYLNVSSNDSEDLSYFNFLLKEWEILDSSGVWEVERLLDEVSAEIEIEKFEKRLLSGDSRITLSEIDALNGYEFEDFLKTLFSKMGYMVEQTRLSGDQGADLVVVKYGEKTIIQAKCYGSKVGNKAVQEIMTAISLYKAHHGMVITNNYFTPQARELAEPNNIELIDRDGLKSMIDSNW